MKQIYTRPSMDILLLSAEESACATASGTEGFTPKDGTWDSVDFNF